MHTYICVCGCASLCNTVCMRMPAAANVASVNWELRIFTHHFSTRECQQTLSHKCMLVCNAYVFIGRSALLNGRATHMV